MQVQSGNGPTAQIITNGLMNQNHPGYNMIIPLPNQPQDVNNNAYGSDWSSGICGCCGHNCGTCCFACFCSPCQMGLTLQKLGIVSSSAIPILLYTIEYIASLGPLFFISSLLLRRSLVDKLNRSENPCYSCCAMCCCFPCAIAQIERDMLDRNYKFEPPILEKNKPQSCCDTLSANFGSISHDSYPRARDTQINLGAPFTKNSMFRYYTRIPSQ
jgi:Cys-rich protein (TIGR01571 family)